MMGIAAAALALAGLRSGQVSAASQPDPHKDFHTADRCVACHNGLKTSTGEDVSFGLKWRASVMANSSRDPYWQGSVRRETIDHPELSADVQDDCSNCHMAAQHLIDKAEGKKTEVFSRLPLLKKHEKDAFAEDGVTCSVCHQIERKGLGTPQTFNGNIEVAGVSNQNQREEYGPFLPDAGHKTIMQSSTKVFIPQQAVHIRDSALCGSCHTLITTVRGPGGKPMGEFPEQMPYQEWQHSDFNKKQSCQNCHMPQVAEEVPITALYGPKRTGMRRHVFIGGNFLLPALLNEHREELDTAAQPEELEAAVKRTSEFLRTQSAKLEVLDLKNTGDGLSFAVKVQNLTGHKLPTAYPSRRAWLHVIVTDDSGRTVFESGALNPDGSIVGNDNDADPQKFEPHHSEISSPDQVEIFEPILGDTNGRVTTGLLNAMKYLKDNRILPNGFDKTTAEPNIAVVGGAHDDPAFIGGTAQIRYDIHGAQGGQYRVKAELWYQPIGFRWAHNLAPYKAAEPQRFVSYYESESKKSAIVLAEAEGKI
ncbi:MAG: hypothetical protein JST28_00465 [Acidobacteria bacterium]|nr:hypothetical protein [Acidobacteriota bacterium]